ncbi:ECF RNA polymerase sigma factor SigE [Thalassocella blandensis]|nr:ECF RNA polymerase sigma factor SigE [Thalassocella blandensis]
MSRMEFLGKEFSSYRRLLMKVVSTIVPAKDVEDVVQDTFIRACQADYEIYQPKPFLMKIARNLALDHIKRAEHRLCDSLHHEEGETAELTLNNMMTDDQTLNEVVSERRFGNFCEAVKTLPPQCKRAFVLKKVYGYTQKEIADEMDISESAVEKHIANGLKRSRKFIRDLENMASIERSSEEVASE